MKKLGFVIGSLFFYLLMHGQFTPAPYPGTGKLNYIRSWTATAPISDENVLQTSGVNDVKSVTEYYDGLGRLLQTVNRKGSLESGSGANNDMIISNTYDLYGREVYKYLGFVSNSTAGNSSLNDGGFKLNPFEQLNAFYTAKYADQNETYFYSKTEYEISPLNRVLKQMTPGNSWVGSSRGIELKQWVNSASDDVKIFTIENETTPGQFGSVSLLTANNGGVYGSGSLIKSVTIDEHGKQIIEYSDKDGKVILKKVQLTAASDLSTGSNYEGWISTYYIYDDYGRLRCVVQPEGVKQLIQNGWVLNNSIYNEQAFRYEYDGNGRIIMKKVPGAEPVYMVYDKRDRLVMTQDANMRTVDNWLVTKYDSYNRPVETGIWNSAIGFPDHLAAAANSESYPVTSGLYTLTLTHYDDYLGLPASLSDYLSTWNSNFSTTYNSWPYPQNPLKESNIKGKVGWTQTRILGTGNFIYSVNYYDAKDRVIQIQSTNVLGGMDVVSTQYTWAGQPYVVVQRQQKPGSGTASEHIQVTKLQYDDLNRVVSVRKSVTSTINGVTKSNPEVEIVRNEYDKLGQLVSKKLGKKRITPETYGTTDLESLSYDYNIRGWLLGVNRAYARDANNDNYFGFDLGYDKQNNNLVGGQTYNTPQYNGNIEGMVWKSRGDREKRKYDFTYDATNRLLKADFTQYTNNTFNQDAGVNFNMRMGDGSFLADGVTLDPTKAYDDNGNIRRMDQWGLKLTGSTQIDQMVYNYKDNEKSNRLRKVTDGILLDNKLGDFKDGTNTSIDDYEYDENGNMISDQNKGITSISYNHLNLPQSISVNGKGTINYQYDAAGNKLQKTIIENNATVVYQGTSYAGVTVTTTTSYIAGSVYESKSYSNATVQAGLGYTDKFQFMSFEEGRIRLVLETNGALKGLSLDYMLKDHLGNVRMLLTDEIKQDIYPAVTLENVSYNGGTAISVEDDFYKITSTQIVPKADATGIPNYENQNNNGVPINNNPYSNNTAYSDYLYKINGNDANKTGLGITLKVMAGDRIDILGKSYYFQQPGQGSTATAAQMLPMILSGLLGSPTGAVAGSGHGEITAAQLEALPNTTGGITGMITQQNNNQASDPPPPLAFINYLFFDEQFKFVSGGFSQAGTQNQLKDHFAELQNKVAQKNGYVYIYVSNTSAINVFFDNLQVVHTRGPILEETHYYPFGLTMAGISSKALNGVAENKKKFIGQLLDDDLGLNWYQFRYRNHDPQIGRFVQIDPLATKYVYNSTYAYAENKVGMGFDLEGLELQEFNRMFRAAGINVDYENRKAQARADNFAKAAEPYVRVTKDVITIAGGVTLLVASGGTAAPILVGLAGSATVAGGTMKLVFDVTGNKEAADQIPTTLSGTAIFLTNGASEAATGQKLISDDVKTVAEFSEGVLTFKVSGFDKMSDVEKASTVLSGLSLTLDGLSPETAKAFQNLLGGGSTNAPALNLDNKPKVDNTYVKPPVILPEKKETNQ